MKIKEIGEFGLIKRLSHNTIFGRGVIRGIGDDAAVLQFDEGKVVLATCDMLVDGVHFLMSKITPYQLGRKALAVSFSDIGAMGGVPRHILISLGIPHHLSVEYVDELYRGLKDLAQEWRTSLVGGDTVHSKIMIIDVMVLGEAKPEEVVLRRGARVGDVIMVTGDLGASAAGLELLLNPLAQSIELEDIHKEIALKAHLEPTPRISEAGVITRVQGATAMMDISDGLASEINHICEESETGAEICSEAIPISKNTRRVAEAFGKDPLRWALYGGEDYELIFTVPPEKAGEVMTRVKEETGVRVSVIGKILPREEGVSITYPDGRRERLGAIGFDHFTSPARSEGLS